MSDSEEAIDYRLQRQVESSFSSDSSEMDNDDDYQQRVILLKKKNDQFDQSESLEKQEPIDLQNLQQKIQRKQNEKQKDKKKKKQKKSFVSPSYLKTAIVMAISRLYDYQQKLEESKPFVLSYFDYDEVMLMEIKQMQNKFQDKLLGIFTQFQTKFKLKKSNSFIRTTEDLQFYPDDYIIQLGALLSVFNMRVRVVMAIDLQFTGLEDKFKVKAIEKEIKLKQIFKDIVLLGDDIVQPVMEDKLIKKLFNKQPPSFMNDEQQQESLDQFSFSKKKKSTLNQSISKNQSEVIRPPIEEKAQVEDKKVNKKLLIKQKINEENHSLNNKGTLFESNNNLWLEIQVENQWLPFDPISDQLCTCDIRFIQRKLHKTCAFFILGTQEVNFTDDFFTFLIQDDRSFQNTYIIDLAWKYLLSYKMIRVRLALEKWFNEFAKKQKLIYCGLPSFLKDPKQILSDQDEIHIHKKQFIPTNEKEFKYHPIYALPSQFNQYQMIHPDAQPCSFKSKDEQVYYKADVIILHTKDRWRDQLLEVKDNEIPIKEVTGRFDKTKITPLFAEWQCQPLKISLEEFNGELPKNPYQNFDLFVHPAPVGTIMFPKLGFKRALQKANINFVEAVNGFEIKNSKMVVIKCGYLIFVRDYEEVQKIFEDHILETQNRNKLNKMKQLQKLWSDLFKVILVKKQITDSYNQQ